MARRSTPFDFWQEAVRGAVMAAETAFAAGEVIASRSATIDDAVRNPLSADHAELALMVGEKVAAFGEAGAIAMRDACLLQAKLASDAVRAGTFAGRGGLSAMGEMLQLWERAAHGVMTTAGAPRRSLKPIHRRATANAKRLKRKAR
jgi:hypothetical protein